MMKFAPHTLNGMRKKNFIIVDKTNIHDVMCDISLPQMCSNVLNFHHDDDDDERENVEQRKILL